MKALGGNIKVQKSMKKARSNTRGLKSDKALLDVVRQVPGLSQYELGKKLGWNAGHVDGAIRRLLNTNKVFIRVLERNGRRVNLVCLQEHKPMNVIEVPEKLLRQANPLWDEHAFFYALDSSTIGISGNEMPEWKEISCFIERIPIQKVSEKLLLMIPEKFWRFYNLERKHRVVSVNGNNVLVTVSGDIIEEKRYPS